MQRFLSRHLITLTAVLSFASACNKEAKDNTSASKSDWDVAATEASASDLKTYAIDWACEPKRFGASSETKIANQDEYCEWMVKSKTATSKQCVFTTSFDTSRSFYLNSRGRTPANSIPAARQLVEDCNAIALTRLNQGKTPGTLCSSITSNCVAGRNSDPEICDKVRWATGEKFAGNLNYCVHQLSQNDGVKLAKPLMEFGILTDLPENCSFSQADHTEVTCTIPLEDDCFSVTGQLRPGLRVVTKATASATPAATTPVVSTPVSSSPSSDDTTTPGLDEELDTSPLEPIPVAVVAKPLPSTRECYVP